VKRRGSVLGQLLIGCCVAAILVAGAVAANYVAITGQNGDARQVTGRYTQLQEAENNLETDFGTADFSVIYYAATGNRSYLSPLGPARAAFAGDLATLRRLAMPSLRDLIEVQARAGATWFALAPKIVSARLQSPAASQLLGRASTLGTSFLTAYTAAEQRLHDNIAFLTQRSKHALATGLVLGSIAMGIAVLLVLATSLSTLYTVTRPLRRLTGTVGRLTAGEHEARAELTGSAEVREVAQSINTLATESERLRDQEARSNRLRALAREVGLRIREPLIAEEVLREAHTGLRQIVDAEVVYLRLLEGDALGRPIGREPGWLIPGDVLGQPLTEDEMSHLRRMFRAQGSMVIQDLEGEDGHQLSPEIRATLRGAGVVSQLITPFGIGAEMAGIIVAQRLRPGPRWSPAEIDAVESVAADLGRGLNHARLYEAENRLVQELRALDQVKSDFFATVSHELRAPLTTIEGYVEMLGDGEAGQVTPQQGKMLDTIARSSVRLRNLVEDLFTLSKLESGGLQPSMRPVSVADLITGAMDAVRPQVDAGGLSLSCTSPGNGLVVAGDVGQLERVLINLLSNAAKFTPAGGHIDVTASPADGSVQILVSDDGIGIPERDQKELFSRFARASNATARRIPGTGLGLVIVRTIVDNHGGSVWLESVEGAGTTVTVQLPLVPAPRAVEETVPRR
jgi:two-component system, OmpR family, phosphate regulon sensor histidine kinase PhoR